MHPFRLAVRALGAAALTALVVTAIPSTRISAAGTPGIDTANFDPTCKPCDDFYQFATGGWTKAHPIPAGHPSWGAFDELQQHNRESLHAILEADAKDTSAPAGSDPQKIGAFYRSCMDEARIEKAGLAPIAPLLAQVASVNGVPSLVTTIAALEQAGVDAGLSFSSEPDTKDSSKTIASIGIGGLGLPDRDYYLRTDDRSQQIRTAYVAYVAKQLQNDGEDPATATTDAQSIMALETALAKATPTRVELRDPQATYHPMPVAQLQTVAPHVPWNSFFAAYPVAKFDTLDVNVPTFLGGFDAQVAATPLPVWKTYLRYHVINAYAQSLPAAFEQTSFNFYGGVLQGVKEQLPLWQRCTASEDRSLRDVLGKAYVARYFPPSAKARAQAMVDNLQSVLNADIGQLSWMSPPTRAKAQSKLAAFTKKIGYPDVWQDYTALQLADGPYAQNMLAVRRFNTERDLARIGKPTDRTLWGMTPSTVNAYYQPSNNEIVFPAGILEPPFFDPQADDAVNYGAIGAVIGHEMTHGFDDQGRQYDARGNLTDWWTPADAAAFKKRAQCIVDEFNGMEVLPGVHENGSLVQGEAIADLGGLTIAYKAFEKTPEFKAGTKIDGYTPAQRFFLAYAQVWRGSQKEAYMRQLATVDPHPNDRLRVIGTLSNMPEFRQAFGCVAGDKMVRTDICQIW